MNIMENQQNGNKHPIVIRVVLAVLMLAFGAYILHFFINSPKSEKTELISSTDETKIQESAPTLEEIDTNFELNVLANEIEEDAYVIFNEGEKAYCQPEDFKVAESVYYVKGGEKSKITEDEEAVEIEVDLSPSDEKGLKEPYRLVSTKFTCDTGESFIIDIRKPSVSTADPLLEGNRLKLFSEVFDWSTSIYSKIFVRNAEKNKVEDWEYEYKIYDVPTDTQIDLPTINCLSGKSFWFGDSLVTYAPSEESELTDFCFWTEDGELKTRFEYAATLDDSMELLDKIGSIKLDKDYFYVVTKNESDPCILYLYTIKDGNHVKTYKLPDSTGSLDYCKDVEIFYDSATGNNLDIGFSLPN